jgi:hypothetical protein
MKKTNDKEKIKNWVFANLFAVAAFASTILNLWLANKLTPLAKDIDKVNTKVEAVEINLNSHKIEQIDVISILTRKIDDLAKAETSNNQDVMKEFQKVYYLLGKQ